MKLYCCGRTVEVFPDIPRVLRRHADMCSAIQENSNVKDDSEYSSSHLRLIVGQFPGSGVVSEVR